MPSTLQLARKAAIPAVPILLASAPSALAQIVYTPDQNLTISSPSDAIYFDLDHSGGGLYAANSYLPGADFSLRFSSPYHLESSGPTLAKPQVAVFGVGRYVSTASSYAPNISPGGSVAAFSYSTSAQNLNKPVVTHANYGNSGFPYYITSYGPWYDNGTRKNDANWAPGTTGYLGFYITGVGYGWARVTYDSSESLTLHDFAINLSGDILAGDTGTPIPEPATSAAATGLAALLAGSAALYAKRRRKTPEPAAAA